MSTNRITVLTLKTVSKAQTESKKASNWVHSSSYVWNECSIRMIAARRPQVISTFILFYTKKSYVQQIEFVHIYIVLPVSKIVS